MKKTFALFTTSLYLLLIGGIYACVLHCTVDFVLANTDDDDGISYATEEQGQDKRKNDEDYPKDIGNCCYHHLTNLVKGNKRAVCYSESTPAYLAFIPNEREGSHFFSENFTQTIRLPTTETPVFFRHPIYILIHSLII
jgi:hypothetical protein